MRLFQELRRRHVFRVAAAYVAVSWLIVQVIETLSSMFDLDEAIGRGIVIVVAVGFIPVVIAAWAYELTPGGLKRDRDVSHDVPVSPRTARRLDHFIMIALALAVAYFAIDKFATPGPDAPDKSIAVMPFIDLSPDADHAYFADGISEELLNYLSKLDGLRVISRSSAFSLRDSGLSTPEVAEKLNVAYVLEGSVKKAGDKFRTTAQLIDAHSDSHLWSETYDHTLEDAILVQEQISAQVAKEMRIRLLVSGDAQANLDGEAYELYLKGLSALANLSPESIPRAIELFGQVIMIDPDYAPAYAKLATALIWSSQNQTARAEEAANRALALDPENSDALAVLGLLWQDGARVEESRDMLERAISSNPNNASAYRWLGTSYSYSDPHRYLKYARKAYLVDPLDRSVLYHFANALSRLGRFDEAIDAARERVALDSGGTSEYGLLATMHWRNGDFGAALKSGYHAYRMAPDDGFYGYTVYFLTELNEMDIAEAWVREIRRRMGFVSPHVEAPMYARRGQHEEAIRLVSDAVEKGKGSNLELAHGVFRNSDDFEYIRSLYDKGFREFGQEQPHFDSNLWWPWFVDYAFVLQRTGAQERAVLMIDAASEYIGNQMAAGV